MYMGGKVMQTSLGRRRLSSTVLPCSCPGCRHHQTSTPGYGHSDDAAPLLHTSSGASPPNPYPDDSTVQDAEVFGGCSPCGCSLHMSPAFSDIQSQKQQGPEEV